jgi:hypothetical protein
MALSQYKTASFTKCSTLARVPPWFVCNSCKFTQKMPPLFTVKNSINIKALAPDGNLFFSVKYLTIPLYTSLPELVYCYESHIPQTLP